MTLQRRQFLKFAGAAALGLGALHPLLGLAASPYSETRLLMGTFVSISLAGLVRDRAQEAMGLAFAEMERLCALYSRHDPASAVSVLNEQGRVDLPPELRALLGKAKTLGELSHQAFNPMVKPMLDLFARYQNPGGVMRIPSGEWREARELIQAGGLILDGQGVRFAASGMGLTLDGLAKGEIVDAASRLLRGLGVANHLINAGGDILAQGSKAAGLPWNVAVENPAGGKPLCVFALASGQAVATSGGNRNYFDADHSHTHLINPMSGQSPRLYSSVSVLAPTAAEADALATGLSVLPPSAARNLISLLPGRGCLLLGEDGSQVSLRWPV